VTITVEESFRRTAVNGRNANDDMDWTAFRTGHFLSNTSPLTTLKDLPELINICPTEYKRLVKPPLHKELWQGGCGGHGSKISSWIGFSSNIPTVCIEWFARN
jgi:hypothetical protein